MVWYNNYESKGYKVGNRYLGIQTTDGGYDYTIYNELYLPEDGGVVETDRPIEDVAKEIMKENGFALSLEIKEISNDFLEESAQLQAAAMMGAL